MNRRWIIFVTAVAFWVFFMGQFGRYLNTVHAPSLSELRVAAKVNRMPFQADKDQTDSLSRTASSPSRAPIEKPHKDLPLEQEWNQFTRRFGSELKPKFSANGQLVSIQGELNQSGQERTDFRSNDVEKIKIRANEIVDAAHGLLKVNSAWPLKIAGVRGGPISAQAFFNQSFQGVPLLPVGNVKVDLGPKGEILALESDYASEIKIVNEDQLSLEQTRKLAMESVSQTADVKRKALPSGQGSPVVQGALGAQSERRVIWVADHDRAYHAHSFLISGREVIVDAQTGDVLLNKDRRQF